MADDTLTFDQMMALFKETREQQAETDRLLKERALEADKRAEEWRREAEERSKEADKRAEARAAEAAARMEKLEKQFAETDKQIGGLHNRFGEVVEYMVAPGLLSKFQSLNYTFTESSQNKRFCDEKGDIFLEVDIYLENGSKALLVEVKNKFTSEDVTHHLGRLKKMRAYADRRGDKRTFMGAAAGVIMTKEVKEYALSKGLFVVEPSGETFNITVPPKNPKEW
jgi:uncharacterized protein YukE